ncbi:non-hydrolyzing UDP-N-acetylglucosamine 2-epimerase [Methanothermobacter sp. THM-2]|uniref:non-hydrolyzing UDP-N-acetylglucosamine 2-epimerase n=1 Tax=Methanothermobacter sp. THM-2 TaxID=2606912 RepID=UPI00136577AB|nr:UDP-N-acetylglucosamine 2-epimerase (non-hydrolyzing) [Methanothermobacter sp. THM-2]QHN07378.1 UDP-N-acetylglucosamine 2-epimerase (non-hydrolyzing) [Methanothermobacter sp. THM-2]
MKIAVVLGTRPEIIKMAPVIDEIERRNLDFTLIHTGQHYDHEMSDQFFIDLELPSPDHNIGAGSGSHGAMTAEMLRGIEDVLIREEPDIVMVQGDTNAVLAGALAAVKLHIPVGHVEAGLRSFDRTMPEEINRMVADVCSKLYYVPTEKSAINLLMEGADPETIFVTGNTVVDACLRNIEIASKKSDILSEFKGDEKIVALTLHRAENVDNPERLRSIVEAIVELDEFRIVFPVHPRTGKNLEKSGLYTALLEAEHVTLKKPMGYLDFLLLLSNSFMVLTDSGGLQEEAITFNVPCLTLRYNTERPETVEAGGNILVGADRNRITTTARRLLEDPDFREGMMGAENPYGDGRASERILDETLQLHREGRLTMKPPLEVMEAPSRRLIHVDEDITVAELAERNNAIIKMVFAGGEPVFPSDTLNLRHKDVLIEYR